jgi:hypothetical protein
MAAGGPSPRCGPSRPRTSSRRRAEPLRIALRGAATQPATFVCHACVSEETSERLAQTNMPNLRDLLDPTGEVERLRTKGPSKRELIPTKILWLIGGVCWAVVWWFLSEL